MEKKIEKKKVVRKKKTPKKHIVVFQDSEAKVIKTVFVEDGQDVVAPEMDTILEEKQHHKIVFSGWNQPLHGIHSNLVISPIYEEIPKEYLIMYFHENGKILGTETVAYGSDAKKPFIPEKPETEEFLYYFEGWNCDLEKIEKDMMAKAVFREERKKFRVRFFDGDNQLLKEELTPYGFDAIAPENVVKQEDATYRYHFQGWDRDFSEVKFPMDIRAIFSEEYINYQIRFFHNKELIQEISYHYRDKIEYPIMIKKGYDFIWDKLVEFAEDSMDFSGDYVYSNPKGKVISCGKGCYEIVNPSISNGSVRCLSYEDEGEMISLPNRVKLGDYFYEVGYIGRKAFDLCPNVKKLICPDSVRVLEKECFAGKTKLETLILGKNIISMDEYLFANCSCLRKIIIHSKKLKKIKKNTFEKMNRRVEMIVHANMMEKMKSLCHSAIIGKEMILKSK